MNKVSFSGIIFADVCHYKLSSPNMQGIETRTQWAIKDDISIIVLKFRIFSEFFVKLRMGNCWGYPRGHFRFLHIFDSIQNLTSDYLPIWPISRGLGAVENPFFDPPSGWEIGWGYPRGALCSVRIFDYLQN